MEDYMIRATARRTGQAEPEIRAFAVTGKELTEYARRAHRTTPVVTAALGRLMCGALMMGDMLKEEKDLMTVRVEGDGPLRGMTVTTDKNGHVKGYPVVSSVLIPPRADGHLDVGGAIGKGTLTVIRDIGMKDPYVGTIALQTGEVAEDLTYYFAVSEQTPSSVGLGVLVSGDGAVLQAGGFVLQLLPFATEETIARLEENIRHAPSVTELLQEGLTPEEMLARLLNGFDLDVNETLPVSFTCNCSKERVESALALIGKEELQKIVADGQEEEINCRFCNRSYRFSPEEMQKILRGI